MNPNSHSLFNILLPNGIFYSGFLRISHLSPFVLLPHSPSSSKQCPVGSTNNEAPHYEIFSRQIFVSSAKFQRCLLPPITMLSQMMRAAGTSENSVNLYQAIRQKTVIPQYEDHVSQPNKTTDAILHKQLFTHPVRCPEQSVHGGQLVYKRKSGTESVNWRSGWFWEVRRVREWVNIIEILHPAGESCHDSAPPPKPHRRDTRTLRATDANWVRLPTWSDSGWLLATSCGDRVSEESRQQQTCGIPSISSDPLGTNHLPPTMRVPSH